MRAIRVMLVDDSEDIRVLYRLLLGLDPAFVVCGEAGDGEEAIRVAACCSPDVILLDLMMPVMDGLTALPLLRELCPTVPVVVMTAVQVDCVWQRALDDGACSVIVKGGDASEVARVLRSAFGLVDASQ